MIPIDPFAKKVILCIDDDASILHYETALLERSGYSVLTASGQEGLDLVSSHHCDAVLLDYQMPGMNGHDVAFELKLRRPDLVIILLSGSGVPMWALALVDAFVPKLEASKQLLPTIAEACNRDTRRTQKSA